MIHQADTNRNARKALRTLYPATAFTIAKGVQRGRRDEWSVCWTGGPAANDVQSALQASGPFYGFTYRREMTESERAAYQVQQDAEYEAWSAAAPAREAARKAEQAAAAAARKAEKAELVERLTAAFPGVEFRVTTNTYGSFRADWKGGPDDKAVERAAKPSYVSCFRVMSDEESAALDVQESKYLADKDAAVAKLRALGRDPDPYTSLKTLQADLTEALHLAAVRRRLARFQTNQALPQRLRRLPLQPLLPMALPISLACYAAPRSYMPASYH